MKGKRPMTKSFEVQRADKEITRHREALEAGRGDPVFHRRKMAEWFEHRCKYVDPREEPITDDLPLKINGVDAATFIKLAYGLRADLSGPGHFDLDDPVQTELRHIRDWITMAEKDALDSRKAA
jgi:hypothetical protein